MLERTSALCGHINPGRQGDLSHGEPGVRLTELTDLQLWQIAAWPDTYTEVEAAAVAAAGADQAPGPCRSVSGNHTAALFQVEPLKWWLLDAEPPALDAAQGSCLDLSHSRSRLRIAGKDTATLLNRHLPLDLRDSEFPVGSVASTAFHHAGVTLWRHADGYDIFLPRGYALSLWELLLQSAQQFGVEVS